MKNTVYESGVTNPIGTTNIRISVKFYLVAISFLLFDVELIFLFPWAVVVKKIGWFALAEVMVFLFILFLGFLYAHKKGALKWQ